MEVYELKKAYREKIAVFEKLSQGKNHIEKLALYKELKELQYQMVLAQLKQTNELAG